MATAWLVADEADPSNIKMLHPCYQTQAPVSSQTHVFKALASYNTCKQTELASSFLQEAFSCSTSFLGNRESIGSLHEASEAQRPQAASIFSKFKPHQSRLHLGTCSIRGLQHFEPGAGAEVVIGLIL